MNYLMNNPLTMIALIIAVIGLMLWIVSSINLIKKDLKRINLKLNKIAHAKEVTDEIKTLVLEGKKIEAIKKYRASTGIGLKEAKEFIDSLSN